ncbi:hypothetical protein L484_014760 [Morus notabilis]|uniref:Pentatricopeptide repeat-containing protein n=1 Tax=Morus notabilis TaxID=981085 RepID=W9R0A3_9ROSA|nr:pentatricopeptide repeat-containing protein At2g37320 [Morus notabilis]EXB31275.1 hypothetical protein L484_014760 [Morus notabilis]
MAFSFNSLPSSSSWNKLSYLLLLQTKSSRLRLFSSYDPTHRLQHTKKLHKALRVLHLITPQTNVTTLSPHRHRHLRLIDELETSSKKSRIMDATVLSLALSSCGSTRNLRAGVQHHCAAIRHGFVANVYVGSSLVSLYCKCNELDNAYLVFEEMPVRNVVSWTAIIAGFAQEWRINVCLELFQRMENSDSRPNHFTFASLLSACSGSGALGLGRSVHSQVIQMGFHAYIHISNALISMYCKCGALRDALHVFRTLDGHGRDTVSWNSMIAGYAQHGLVLQAIDLFEEMKQQGAKSDAITFLGVLSSCRHAGLVKEGRLYFDSMVEHGVEPELDHYSCIVDLLGRAGLLEEARDVIAKMPIRPNAIIWGSLLSSSRIHGSIGLGIEAAEERLLLEPSCAATYLQLANLYAGVGWWDNAARMRKLMKDKGLKTSPGYSWIEINNVVYRFKVEDRSNTRMVDIHAILDCLLDHMKTLGFGCDPKMLEEEEVDHALYMT